MLSVNAMRELPTIQAFFKTSLNFIRFERIRDFMCYPFSCLTLKSRTLTPKPLNRNTLTNFELINDPLKLIEFIKLEGINPQTRAKLKEILEAITPENLTSFFSYLLQWKAAEPNPALPDEILELLSIEKLQAVLASGISVEEKIDLIAQRELGMGTQHRGFVKLEAPDPRSSNIISRLFPNFFSLVFRAFDYFDSENTPGTLLEYTTLVTLYLRFFKQPLELFNGLSPLANNILDAVLITSVICAAILAAAYAYLRWLMPCPETVDWTDNISAQIKSGLIRPNPVKFHQKEIAEISESLNHAQKRFNGILIGEPGTGKSNMIEYLAAVNPDKKFFRFKSTELLDMGASYLGPSPKISQALRQTRYHRDQIIFCFDEMGEAYKRNPQTVIGLINNLKNTGIHFIAAMTTDQWTDFIKEEGIGQKLRAFYLETTNTEQTKTILKHTLKNLPQESRFDDLCIAKIVELTESIKTRAQPRFAKDFLDYLLLKISSFKPSDFKTTELIEAEEERETIQSSLQWNKGGQERAEVEDQFAKIKKKLHSLRIENEQIRNKLSKLQKLIDYHNLCLETRNQNIIQLVSGKNKSTQESLKKQFLFTDLFALTELTQKIDQLSQHIKEELTKEIKKDLNEEVSKEDQKNRKQDWNKIYLQVDEQKIEQAFNDFINIKLETRKLIGQHA